MEKFDGKSIIYIKINLETGTNEMRLYKNQMTHDTISCLISTRRFNLIVLLVADGLFYNLASMSMLYTHFKDDLVYVFFLDKKREL